LDPCSGGFATKFVTQNGEPADTVVAVRVGEIPSALEETSYGVLARARSGLVELGFGGL